MKKKLKKALSFFLTTAFVLSAAAPTVFAAPPPAPPTNGIDFTTLGSTTFASSDGGSGKASWTAGDNCLKLENFVYEPTAAVTTSSTAIILPAGSKIELIGESTITAKDGATEISKAIDAKGDLRIYSPDGTGILNLYSGDVTATSELPAINSYGLYVQGHLEMGRSKVNTTGGDVLIPGRGTSYGVKAATMEALAGELNGFGGTATSTAPSPNPKVANSYGVYCTGDFKIASGKVYGEGNTASQTSIGFYIGAGGDGTIQGGEVYGKSGSAGGTSAGVFLGSSASPVQCDISYTGLLIGECGDSGSASNRFGVYSYADITSGTGVSAKATGGTTVGAPDTLKYFPAPDRTYKNEAGTVVATYVKLEKGTPPGPYIVIASQPSAPADQTYDNINASVKVWGTIQNGTGSETISYQWYENTSSSNSGGTAISGETADEMEIPTDLNVGDYYYYCELSADGCSSLKTNAVKVTVVKANYNGTTAVTDSVLINETTTGKDCALPALPDGASYGTGVVGGNTPALITSQSISGETLTYSTDSVSAETSATITIPVTGATNYNDYNVIVTINATDKTPVSLSASSYTKTYDGQAVDIDDIQKSARATGTDIEVDGTWSFENQQDLINANSGVSVELRFTPDDEDEYLGGTVSVTVTIDPAIITITPDNKTATAGDKEPRYTYTVTGLANGEYLQQEPTLQAENVNMNKAGNYTITAEGAVAPEDNLPRTIGPVSPNYESDIYYQTGVLTVKEGKGSGGGGGGGGVLSNDKVTEPADDVDLNITTEEKDGALKAVLSKDEEQELIKDAKEHGNVVINPKGAAGAKNVEVTISKDTVTALAKETEASIDINAGDGFDVKIPHQELSKVSDDLTITATKAGGNQYAVTAKSGDSNVSLTTIASFKNTDGNVAYIVDANGNKEPIKFSVVDGDRVYAQVKTPATIVIEKHENLFSDMLTHAMKTDADFVANRGLFVGVGDDTFAPSNNMTMGMMASVLHRLAGEPATAASGSEWYAQGMGWASANNMITANDPSHIITRQDLATTLYRFAKANGMDTTVPAGTAAFSDISHLSGESKDAIEWAAATGILQGYGNGTVGVENECTRIQVAAMLERFIGTCVK